MSLKVSFIREGIPGTFHHDFATLAHYHHFTFCCQKHNLPAFSSCEPCQDSLPRVLAISQDQTEGELIFDVVMSRGYVAVTTTRSSTWRIGRINNFDKHSVYTSTIC